MYLLRTNRPPYRSIPLIGFLHFFPTLTWFQVILTSTIRWQIPAAPYLKENLPFLHATLMPLSKSHNAFSKPPGIILGSRLTPFCDPLCWTWPLRIPPSRP